MKRKLILVVDNEPAILHVCSEYLTKAMGCRILKADCCSGAINILLKDTPDCVVLDYTLPDGDARRVCAAMKCDGKTTPPVIIFSGSEDAVICLKGEYPADIVVSKDTPLKELVNLINTAVTDRKHLREK